MLFYYYYKFLQKHNPYALETINNYMNLEQFFLCTLRTGEKVTIGDQSIELTGQRLSFTTREVGHLGINIQQFNELIQKG